MSYLTFPRLHFSGTFKTYPSTINNTPTNYDPNMYPGPNDLCRVELGWGPRGDGSFDLKDCVVTQIDYADGSSATRAEEDSLIGQPVATLANPSFPLPGALVDLDPQQQAVSEIWGMTIQIGGEDEYLRGNFAPAAFNSMWGNVQGPNAPRSSASASAIYQSKLKNIETNGLTSSSKFLKYFSDNPATALSINFVVSSHNNKPPIYALNGETFNKLEAAGVSTVVLNKIKPMQQMVQNFGSKPGNIPTKEFLTYQLQQYLTDDEYNGSIEKILQITSVIPYKGSTPYPFTYGFLAGTVGTSTDVAADFFVPSRMMAPMPDAGTVNFAAFNVSDDGKTVSVNLSNSIAVYEPGIDYSQKLAGNLWLVTFPGGNISADNAVKLASIPYTDGGFMTKRAGMFTTKQTADLSETPLGILSIDNNNTETILLAENKDGYYLRADQFVFRMNPGVDSTAEDPRGQTANVNIHALKFGKPVPDGTKISLSDRDMSQNEPPALSTPADALTIKPASGVKSTKAGIAQFTLTAKDPKNPRGYINGQLYFKNYQFSKRAIAKTYTPDPNDFISIQIYDQNTGGKAIDILNKYGRLYKIMGFLADDDKVNERRNMIKLMMNKPMTEIVYMPVTRDISDADLKNITDWIDTLNNS